MTRKGFGIQESRAVSEEQFDPLLDSEEAAALLGIHPKTLQRLARRVGQVILASGSNANIRRLTNSVFS